MRVFSPNFGPLDEHRITHGTGKILAVNVVFSEAITVVGTPMLELATDPPRNATYVGMSDDGTVAVFWYAVQPGDMADGLDYASKDALHVNGGSITGSASGVKANTTLAEPGEENSLAYWEQGRPLKVPAEGRTDIYAERHPVLIPVDSVKNGTRGFDVLSNSHDVSVFSMNNSMYAIVASSRDNGVQLIRIHGNGTLEAANSATDGSDSFDVLRESQGVSTFTMNNGAYAVVASRGDSGVQLIRIHGNGTLEAVRSVTGPDSDPSRDFRLQSTGFITTFMLGNNAQALATAFGPDTVQGGLRLIHG